MDWETRIEEWELAHAGELAADIARLVEIPSVAGEPDGTHPFGKDCARVLELYLQMAQGYGFSAQNLDGYGGRVQWGRSKKTVGLWAHLDVVPAGDGWTYPPFACTRRGDLLVGRGVQDNKGPAVLDLYVLRCLRDLEIPLKSAVAVLAGCCEEAGMQDIPHILNRTPAPDFSMVTDCGFPLSYGEKGMLQGTLRRSAVLDRVLALEGGAVSNVVPDTASLLLRRDGEVEERRKRLPVSIQITEELGGLRLTAHGISRHAAFPQGGVNAVALLLQGVLDADLAQGPERDALAFLWEIADRTDGSSLGIACSDQESGELTCVGSVARGERGGLSLTLDIRYPVTTDSVALLHSIRGRCRSRGFVLEDVKDNPPYLHDPQSPKLTALMGAYRRVTGADTQPYVMGGGTYARRIPNAVAFGPALPRDFSALDLPVGHGDCHCPDEAEHVSNLLKALRIYVLALMAVDDYL